MEQEYRLVFLWIFLFSAIVIGGLIANHPVIHGQQVLVGKYPLVLGAQTAK